MARTKAAQFPDVKWSKNKFEITIKLLEIVQQRSLLGGWPNFAMGVEESQELAWLLLGSRPVYRDCFRRDPGLAKATYGQRIRDRTHQIETQFYGNGPTGESWRARAWPDRVVELLNVLMGEDSRMP